jgi:hypothetical protein
MMGLLLAVVAVVLQEAHFSNVVSWTIGAPVVSKPPLRTCLWTHECVIFHADDGLLWSTLAISGVTLMGWIALRNRKRRARASGGVE